MGWFTQTPHAQVSMRDEPHHHFVFETETFRVFEPRIEPGDVTLDHRHAYDMVTVCIGGSSLRNRELGSDWSPPVSPCMLGRVSVTEYAGHEATHRVENVGTGVYRLLAVENLRVANWSRSAPIAAASTTLLRGSRAFSVYEIRLDHATDHTVHLHQQPTIIVLVSGQALVAIDERHELSRLDESGRWHLTTAGQRHNVMAASPDGMRAVEIEIH